VAPKPKGSVQRSAAFARGGDDRMVKPQAAGPIKAGQTGKAQTPAPGKRAAAGGPPIRRGASSVPVKAGHTAPPRKGR
jgi:hypothetical protein